MCPAAAKREHGLRAFTLSGDEQVALQRQNGKSQQHTDAKENAADQLQLLKRLDGGGIALIVHAQSEALRAERLR